MPRRKKQTVACSVDPAVICALVQKFASEDGLEREKARRSLVALGKADVTGDVPAWYEFFDMAYDKINEFPSEADVFA